MRIIWREDTLSKFSVLQHGDAEKSVRRENHQSHDGDKMNNYIYEKYKNLKDNSLHPNEALSISKSIEKDLEMLESKKYMSCRKLIYLMQNY